jgi:surface polysaccharide O-acyltransferase-like enzyme
LNLSRGTMKISIFAVPLFFLIHSNFRREKSLAAQRRRDGNLN